MAAGSQRLLQLLALFSKAEQPENHKLAEVTQSEMSPHQLLLALCRQQDLAPRTDNGASEALTGLHVKYYVVED